MRSTRERERGGRRTDGEDDGVDFTVAGFEGFLPAVADVLDFEAVAADKLGLALLDVALHLCIVVEHACGA